MKEDSDALMVVACFKFSIIWTHDPLPALSFSPTHLLLCTVSSAITANVTLNIIRGIGTRVDRVSKLEERADTDPQWNLEKRLEISIHAILCNTFAVCPRDWTYDRLAISLRP